MDQPITQLDSHMGRYLAHKIQHTPTCTWWEVHDIPYHKRNSLSLNLLSFSFILRVNRDSLAGYVGALF